MSEVRSYRDLLVWQRAMDLALGIYALSRSFPDSERFAMVSQLRRAAVSVPSNIAEGHARSSTRDFLRFLSIASGSLAELETQLILAHRLDYLDQDRLDSTLVLAGETGRMIRGLQTSLASRIAAAP
ncbi:MAG: four helix bundle protein [Methyloversatilis discipulorum]|uniref:four helix bundle protein n=1 Tax=Methyloversatilis discipulorum TaxID=1119528 RepID=UPI0026F32BA7|nr:four helix bundle protein [Methyloversatilis discipulorum]MBV5286916.1 four helix bundle protein [Methyloversatilis discipulorum]